VSDERFACITQRTDGELATGETRAIQAIVATGAAVIASNKSLLMLASTVMKRDRVAGRKRVPRS
jgi:hypothetical protein